MIIILWNVKIGKDLVALTVSYREGGVRRGHGLRPFRLSVSSRFPFLVSSSINVFSFRFVSCLPFLP